MPINIRHVFFALTFIGFGVLGAMFPIPYMVARWSRFSPTAVSMLHAGVLMKLGGYGLLPRCHVSDATGL